MSDRKYLAFPKNLEDLRKAMPELLAILQEGQDWYAFVTLDDFWQKDVTVHKAQSNSLKLDRGMVMRIVSGGQNFEYASNQLELEPLKKQAKALVQKALKQKKQSADLAEYQALSWSEEDLSALPCVMKDQLSSKLQSFSNQDWQHFGTPYIEDPQQTEISQMMQRAQKIREEVLKRCSVELPLVGVSLRQKIKTKVFVDRFKNMSQSLLTSLNYSYAISPKGRNARVIRGATGGWESTQIGDADFEYLAKMPLKLDEAKLLKPGRYPLITGPDVTGVIAHEAFGHTQEGDTCRYGRSCAPHLLKNKTQVGNEQASIVNFAAVFEMGQQQAGSNGSHFFDDEGQLSRPQLILDKGYLTPPMNDLLSSIKGDINGKAARQSNGKRESWRNPIMARQTNTYFTPGDQSLEQLIGQVDYGFLAEHAYGGMEDPKGMGLTAGTSYLQEIEGGKLTGEIFLGPKGGHVELSDPVPSILKGIVAKSYIDGPEDPQGSIPHNKWGGCGKYHKESVEAGAGGPWILWKGINCG